jgi:hypothetical protein
MPYAVELVTERYDGEEARLVLTDIVERVSTPAFQTDPLAYMAQWVIDRGMTLEWRMPEDASRGVIQAVLNELEWEGIPRARELAIKSCDRLPQEQLIHEIYTRTISEEFRADPEAYMAAWRVARGYTKEYRFPEDPTRSIIGTVLKELRTPSETSWQGMQQVRESVEASWPEPIARQILTLIEEHVATQEFQRNPERYMRVWELRRGHTEEYRFPEDPAREALQQVVTEIGS